MMQFADLESLIPVDDWKLDGLCVKAESDRLWFPESAGEARWNNHRAKAICAVCPVRAACRMEAIEKGEAGIWGGTTEGERDDMLAAWNRSAVAA